MSYVEVSEYAVRYWVKHRMVKGENNSSRALGAHWSPQDPMATHQPKITTNQHGLHIPRPIYT